MPTQKLIYNEKVKKLNSKMYNQVCKYYLKNLSVFLSCIISKTIASQKWLFKLS